MLIINSVNLGTEDEIGDEFDYNSITGKPIANYRWLKSMAITVKTFRKLSIFTYSFVIADVSLFILLWESFSQLRQF